jgi:hypothetical protein
MTRRLATLLALVCLLAANSALASASPASAAEPGDDAAAAMYQPDTVVAIHLTLPPASIAKLEAEPEEEYVEGTFSMAETDGTPGGVGAFGAPIKVGIRLKGGVGSFRPLPDGKSAFKVKFSFVKGQKFLGLKKLTLNNMVQDESMLGESLSYRAFRALDVPAPRTGYAYLTVNGVGYGVYLNIEDLDDVALEKRFGKFDDPQHLYEGEYGVDVEPGAAEIGQPGSYEVDEGDEVEVQDLETLIAKAGEAVPDFSDNIAPYADLAEMTRMWAIEKYIGHWDGYSGEEGTPLPNNYYLYSSAAGQFQMLPWGTDQTWGTRLPFEGDAGLLFDRCLADASCKAEYRMALGEALATVNALNLSSAARCTAALLAPWQALETVPRRPYSPAQTAARIASLRDFAETRPQDLAGFLGVPAPALPAPRPCKSEVSSPAAAATTAPPSTASPPPLALGRVRVRNGLLFARIRAPAVGTATLRVASNARAAAVDVCRAKAHAAAAERLELSCALSAPIRKRLERRWLRLQVSAAFISRAGKAEAVGRSVRIAARAAPDRRR